MISRWGKKLDCFALARNDGFTLAEVLITLGIIGVVAAMTIPSLYTKVQDQIFKTRWKKTYSDLSQAFKLLYSDDDIDVDSYFACTENTCFHPLLVAIIEKYRHKANVVERENLGWGVLAQYTSIEGEKWQKNTPHFSGHYYRMIKDMTFTVWDYYPHGGTIWVDVNGHKHKPNVVGRDLFAVEVRNGKIEPVIENSYAKCAIPNRTSNFIDYQGIGYADDGTEIDNSPSQYKGIGCSAKYIYEK